MAVIESFIALFHQFNDFLGTLGGELLKNSIDLVLFTIVLYMLISEWLKYKKNDLLPLIAAFATLMLARAFMTLVQGFLIFRKIPEIIWYQPFIPVFEQGLQLFSLILLTTAFLYPIYKNKQKQYYSFILLQIYLLVIIVSIAQLIWFNTLDNNLNFNFKTHIVFLIFEIIKFAVLLYTIYLILYNTKLIGKYANHILLAFLIYLCIPIITIINYLFFESSNKLLRVIVHPLPFLATLFFLRVIFLKLVDKATLQQQLSETKQKYKVAKELNKLKDEFVSIVSHELRTPLTNIKLYLSLLLRGEFGKITKQQKETVNIVNDESNRLSNLIEDILSLAKFEQKKERLFLKQCNLHDLVEKTIYHALAKQKKIIIKNHIPQNMIITLDEGKIKQVIINLFSNAIKFTPEKGVITFTAEERQDSFILKIIDTGIGIPKDKIPKLFNKFYQVENHLTRTVAGTGLGLVIVKKIIELHQGKIFVESELDRGTTFIIVIPKSITINNELNNTHK